MQFAKTLVHLKVEAYHIVNILGFNSVHIHAILIMIPD